MEFKSIVKKEKGIKDWLKGYCSPKQSQRSVDTNSWISMFALFDENQKDFLASTWSIICSEKSSMSLNFRHAWMTVKFSLLSGYGVDRLNLSELGMKQDTRCSDERKQQSSRGII